MRWLILPLLFFYSQSFSQCKTYRVTSGGDTLNCTDFNNLKQGKWVIHLDELRGEPGFEEEGVYKNNKKEGPWRRYNLMGDLIATENFRWGFKDGIQRYFSVGAIEHEESWRAVDPSKKFDTIDVPDPIDPMKSTRTQIKVETYSQHHGVWKYYRPGSMSLLRTETYFFDKLMMPISEPPEKNIIVVVPDSTKKAEPEKTKPKEVLDFEKKKKSTKSKGKGGGL